MRGFIVLFSVFSLAIISACSQKLTGFRSSTGSTQAVELVRVFDWTNFSKDPVQITDMRMTGDTIMISVVFSGGWNEHEFRLIADYGNYNPYNPTIAMALWHDSRGDSFEMTMNRTLYFDMGPLKEYLAHKKAGPAIDLVIQGYQPATFYTLK